MFKSVLSSLGSRISFYVSCFIIIVMTVIGGMVNSKILILGIVLFVLYLLISFIVAYLKQRSLPKKETATIMNSLNERLISGLDEPIVVIGKDDEIVMSNEAFAVRSKRDSIKFRESIGAITGNAVTFAKLASLKQGEPMSIQSLDGLFDIERIPVDLGSKKYYITVWHDTSEVNTLRRKEYERNILVAFIVVDNSNEINQNAQENYRSASAKVSRILDEWADSFNAIIKEYERDKYIMLFEQQYLDMMIADKFGILDEIRTKSEDELGVPLTVSIGISRTGTTLEEKEQSSAQALSMGLQRGGDQAVLKNDMETLFFGGRTKTMQKMTKIRSRIIANELMSMMQNASNVIVMGHRYADHDSIGACIGAARMAMSNGKRTNIVVNREDENLKLVFAKMEPLDEYRDIFVDKLTGQDLLTPDTLLVIVDVNNKNLYEAPDIFDNAQKIAIIDHHRKTAEFSKDIALSYIEPSASSACELISELLEQSLAPNSVLKDEAEMLLSGMMLDTKNFTSNAGVRTFSAAMYLRGEGADPQDTQILFKSSYDEYMRQDSFVKNTYIYREGVVISYSNKVSTQKDKIVAAKLADGLLNMKDISASFVMCSIDGNVHISARSNGNVNVQLVLEPLKGGGRYDNAGAQLYNTEMTDAIESLEGAIDRYFAQLA